MGRLGLRVEGFECQVPTHVCLNLESLWSHGRTLCSTVTASDWWFRKITPQVRRRLSGEGHEKWGTGLDTCYNKLQPLPAAPSLLVLLDYLTTNRKLTWSSTPPTPTNSATPSDRKFIFMRHDENMENRETTITSCHMAGERQAKGSALHYSFHACICGSAQVLLWKQP